jgi:hypothetical protein
MRWIRHVMCSNAADLDAESAFWAGMLSGQMFADDTFHTVIDGDGMWSIGVQLAPTTFLPSGPTATHSRSTSTSTSMTRRQATTEPSSWGARMPYPDDLDSAEGHHVYADPAGHPFFIGRGHPDEAALRAFVERQR